MRRVVAVVAGVALVASCATARRHRTASVSLGIAAGVPLVMGTATVTACTPSAPDDCDAAYDAKVFGGFAAIGTAIAVLVAYEMHEHDRDRGAGTIRRDERTISFGGNDDVRPGPPDDPRKRATVWDDDASAACAVAKNEIVNQVLEDCEDAGQSVGAIPDYDSGCACSAGSRSASCTTAGHGECTAEKADSIALGAGAAPSERVAAREALDEARAMCARYHLAATAEPAKCACTGGACTCLVRAACD